MQNVYDRHKLSVAMLTYLFENKVPNEQFWELIENYFLGEIPPVVTAAVQRWLPVAIQLTICVTIAVYTTIADM